MNYHGNILKMHAAVNGGVVQYHLPVGEHLLPMNDLIGKQVQLKFENRINCIKCGRKTSKSFNQGFCYPCFKTAPEADPAIIKPELDQAHLGVSRDMEWAETHSLVPHIVYMSLTSGLKVGVTRKQQIPTRWIDQGARKAIKLAETPYRQLAGLIEVELKKHFDDKTNWRHMLTNKVSFEIELEKEKVRAGDLLPEELKKYLLEDDEVMEINYPVEKYPLKVKSIGFDKVPEYTGVLAGIKGQYLIFSDNHVLNIRKHNGYYISIQL